MCNSRQTGQPSAAKTQRSATRLPLPPVPTPASAPVTKRSMSAPCGSTQVPPANSLIADILPNPVEKDDLSVSNFYECLDDALLLSSSSRLSYHFTPLDDSFYDLSVYEEHFRESDENLAESHDYFVYESSSETSQCSYESPIYEEIPTPHSKSTQSKPRFERSISAPSRINTRRLKTSPFIRTFANSGRRYRSKSQTSLRDTSVSEASQASRSATIAVWRETSL